MCGGRLSGCGCCSSPASRLRQVGAYARRPDRALPQSTTVHAPRGSACDRSHGGSCLALRGAAGWACAESGTAVHPGFAVAYDDPRRSGEYGGGRSEGQKIAGRERRQRNRANIIPLGRKTPPTFTDPPAIPCPRTPFPHSALPAARRALAPATQHGRGRRQERRALDACCHTQETDLSSYLRAA
jgi:hypothetical protein